MHDYLFALLGGSLLGLATVGYLIFYGKIAGISGLIAQSISSRVFYKQSGFWFVVGIFVVPFFYTLFSSPDIHISSSPFTLIIAGLLVGFGTRLGSGCTSGHGICGISRLSLRSLIATLIFMLAGFITVYVIRHSLGGQ